MKKLFVPYELALLAKEKGFDEECFAEYDASNLVEYKFKLLNNPISNKNAFFAITAPLYQQLVDWFDEKHGIRIDFIHSEATGKYKYAIWELVFGKWTKQFNATSEFTKKERNIKAITEAFKLI